MTSSSSWLVVSTSTSAVRTKEVVGHTKARRQGNTRLVSELMRGGNCRDGNSVLAISRMLLRSTSSALLSSASLLLLLTLPASNGADEGDACTVDRAPGICRLLPDCQSVYDDLLRGNPPRAVCGYSNFDPVVCCPTGASVTAGSTSATGKPVVTGGRGAVARAQCEVYSRSVYATVIPPILTANRQPVNISLCAIKTRKLIVGGTKSDPKEFPHMAAVGYDSPTGGIQWSCGGTLISERFVLTAAHCLYSVNWGNANWVRLGDLNLVRTDDDAKPQTLRVERRIQHPDYKWPSAYNDIALLKMERDVQFDAWIRPSCLAYSLPDVGNDGKAVATGWGVVDWNDDRGSSDLLKVTIKLVSTQKCNSSFNQESKLERGINNESQLCAGEEGKDTCQGDSGGPLAIYNNDYNCMYSLMGVTSIGSLCGSIIPGVYTRVYHYIPWIESVVWPNSV
ncbi:venom protease-like [Andrena cerasifolii]|uniref:venom protease-like n=1 Tax=Andrena cerasifolii TaxID=2819439 RepID=UPI00403767BD